MAKFNLKSREQARYTAVSKDWNAKVGNNKEEYVIGLHGLGNRMEQEKNIDFCQSNDLFIASIVFQQLKQCLQSILYTC